MRRSVNLIPSNEPKTLPTIRLSKNNNYLAAGQYDKRVFIINIKTRQTIDVLEFNDYVRRVIWSDDSKTLTIIIGGILQDKEEKFIYNMPE